jgi:Ser/Thr protein kinase RdoA (MazF antagonist)
MAQDPTPRLSTAEAVRIARESFGLTALATVLPSERDQNFLLQAAAGERYVLKIAKADEPRAVLEFQNALLRHVAGRAPGLAVPRVHPTRAGAELEQVQAGDGRAHFVRLIGWLEGQMYAAALPHQAGLLASLGVMLGELDRALEDFSHPAMRRVLEWDLKCADLALAHAPLLAGAQQQCVRQLMAPWHGIDWGSLRHGVIHGDANDHNVLVRDGAVAGVIDFGDSLHSAVVGDVAIAIAYAMLDQPQPLEAAAIILRAYHARFPLQRAEIDAVYALVCARLCMSVCIAAYNAQAKSGDAYQQVTAGPAWELLQRLAAVAPAAAAATLRSACTASAA